MSRFKPCPFCGSSDIQAESMSGFDEWIVSCRNCNARIHRFIAGKDKTIAAWNTRTPQAEEEAGNGN